MYKELYDMMATRYEHFAREHEVLAVTLTSLESADPDLDAEKHRLADKERHEAARCQELMAEFQRLRDK